VEAERKARERAEELLQAKTTFLNNMSHELRTPLASIIGFAEVLAEEGKGEQREFAERIGGSGERLRDTLNSILSLAQIDGTGNTGVEMEPTDAAAEVREAATSHRHAAEQKGLFLEVETPTGEVRAPLNTGALHRILDNLIGNAIKFTEKGGVTVRVEAEAQAVRLCVEDTGIGISEAFREKLFDDFTQESTGLGRTHEGSGLGLAITQRLVEQMDGTLDVESQQGEGTRFSIRFARTAPEKPVSTPEEDAAPVRTDGRGLASRLLLVEDNPNTRALARHVLQVRHYVVCAEGVEDALAAVEEWEAEKNGGKAEKPEAALGVAPEVALEAAPEAAGFDALLIDINLGGREDGVGLLHRLRGRPAIADVPAVAFTAHAMPGDEERLREAGFDGYVAKPFSKEGLLEAVENVLDPAEPQFAEATRM
jgi:CheY-like chemotaxis protein